MERLTGKSGHGAGGYGFGGLLDLDEAHAAVPGDGEAAVVAEARDVHAGDLTGLENRHALGDFHRVPIHEHLDGVIRVREVDSSPADRSPRWWREIRRRFGLGNRGFRSVELRCRDNGPDLEEKIPGEF